MIAPPEPLEKRWLRELAARLNPDLLSDEFAGDRERCRSLSAFIESAWHTIEPGTPYLSNWHIDAIAEHLEAVTAGQIKRLLINMPPRYMKSIACSVMWPVWEWTRAPHRRYMFSTYSGDLSKDHAHARRTVLQSDWFRDRWASAFKLTTDNIMSVMNDHRGVFTATSFTGSATGKGANRLVVDDPHNPKQADSDVERATAVRLFNTTFLSRLNNKFEDAIVVVMQRLHEEDVSARCLEQGYTHLCLPAESEGRSTIVFPLSGRTRTREDGELLWPEREGPDQIAEQKAQGSYYFAGQYQQRPAPAGGGLFTTFPVVHAVPVGCRWVRYWDKAGTDSGGDYSAGVLMARSPAGEYYIFDVIRGQWSAGKREEVIANTAAVDGRHVHVWVEQEPGSGGKESAENTVKMLAGFVACKERVTGDKVTRARPLAAQAEVGNVKMIGGHWNAAFLDEARVFPNGRHDDQIDAAAGAFNKLSLVPRPTPAAASPPPRIAPVPTGVPASVPHALSGPKRQLW